MHKIVWVFSQENTQTNKTTKMWRKKTELNFSKLPLKIKLKNLTNHREK